MNFIDWVEKHRRSLIFVAVALTLAGIYAGITLPIGLFPVVSFPRIRVEIDSGSMPSRQMLIEVTEPLEKVARNVPGAVDVESTTTRGSAEMFIDFPWGWDMKRAAQAVQGAFAQKLPDLPPGVGYDVLQMRPTALMPFVSYAMISNKISSSDLRQIARYQITPLLDGIPGVSRVSVLGGQQPEVQVYVSPQKLRAYGLTMSDVENAISNTNTLDAVGQFQDNYLLYLAITSGAFDSVNSVKNVTLHTGQHGV
ncbi:MAG: efflux RND transporter permease subunit, partial [Gemmataceae bacterium]